MPYMSSYAAVMSERKAGDEHDEQLLNGLVAHVSAHVMKARVRQQRHDSRLKKKKSKAIAKSKAKAIDQAIGTAHDDHADGSGSSDDDADADAEDKTGAAMQDQGFTRPRVLVLCPFRGSCFNFVEALINFFGENTSVTKLDQFAEEYGYEGSDDEDGDDDGNKTAARRRAKEPADWRALFKQNADDDFKMGIQINPGKGRGNGADKGVQLRLFSDFYMADIIVASPLGLRVLAESSKLKNFDFLSSLEVLTLYQADVMAMQNWEHVDFVMKHCNKQPVEDHSTDFSRIRPYFLTEGDSAKHRQLLVSTHFNSPEIRALFRTYSQSRAGCLRVRAAQYEGVLGDVTSKVQQVFQRVPCESFTQESTTRFEFFTQSILSQVLRMEQPRTLIVSPSYLDFVMLRNELIRQKADAAFVCEYSRESEISRGRSRFFHGKKDIMLYSGRAHFFRRFMIRGALHVIFYSLPQYEQFYPELVNLVGDIGKNETGDDHVTLSCTVLFTKYETMALERIVGTKRAQRMHTSSKNTFMFC
jgi:U3 small nucleolar RNA-associated protein 25